MALSFKALKFRRLVPESGPTVRGRGGSRPSASILCPSVPGKVAVSSGDHQERLYQLWPGAPGQGTRQGTNMASAWRGKKVKFNLSELTSCLRS